MNGITIEMVLIGVGAIFLLVGVLKLHVKEISVVPINNYIKACLKTL